MRETTEKKAKKEERLILVTELERKIKASQGAKAITAPSISSKGLKLYLTIPKVKPSKAKINSNQNHPEAKNLREIKKPKLIPTKARVAVEKI